MERKIILTPKCYKLWTVRPGFLLLYDKVVLDEQDYNDIVSRQNASTYDFLVYKNIERLNKEGFIEVIDYSKILTTEKRKNIHSEAKKFVSQLSDKELMYFSFHVRKEYIQLLKDMLACCYSDEPRYQEIIEEIRKTEQMVRKLEETRNISQAYIEVLERISAKVIAGIIVVSNFSGGILHDTNEYKPFFEKYKSGKNISDLPYEMNRNFNTQMVIATLFNKPYPVVNFYDEKSFYDFIKTRDDFVRVKNLLIQVEETYGELLEADRRKVFEELKKEISSISTACDKEFQKLKNKLFRKILWGTVEELGGKFVPLFRILLDPLYRKNDELLKKEIEEKIVNRDSLGGNLYLLYKKIPNKKLEFELPRLKHYDYKKPPPGWGEEGAPLPWYEK